MLKGSLKIKVLNKDWLSVKVDNKNKLLNQEAKQVLDEAEVSEEDHSTVDVEVVEVLVEETRMELQKPQQKK